MEEEIMECFVKGETVEQVQKKFPKYTEAEIRKIYMKKEQDILVLRLETTEEVAKKTGVTQSNIYRVRSLHTYKGVPLKDVIKKKKEELKKLLAQKKTVKDISEQLGVESRIVEEHIAKGEIVDNVVNGKIVEEFIKGKTIKEIQEKYPEYTTEKLEEIYKLREREILILRLIPQKQVAELVKQDYSTITNIKRKFEYKGKKIIDIVKEKQNKVKQMIREGHSPKNIAKSLNVDEKIVENIAEKIDLNVDNNKTRDKNNKEKRNGRNTYKTLSLTKRIRANYKKIMSENNDKDNINSKNVVNSELINMQIKQLQRIIESKEDTRLIQTEKILKNLSSLPLSLSQTNIIEDAIKQIPANVSVTAKKKIDRLKNYIIGRSLERAIIKANTIEELQELKKQIEKSGNNFQKNALMYKIRERVSKLKQKEKINIINNEYEKIAEGIVNGNLNIEKAIEIINKRAIENVKKGPKNKFALTEEQHKKQILMKITKTIANNPESFQIKDAGATIKLLTKLLGKSEIDVLDIVINNLLETDKLQEAEEICKKYKSIEKAVEEKIKIKRLENKIEKAKIGQQIARCLETENDDLNSNILEGELYKIKNSKFNLSSIPLGKREDGKRITLQDIWPENDLQKGNQK